MIRAIPHLHVDQPCDVPTGQHSAAVGWKWPLIAVLLVALAGRLVFVHQPGLHPDEALYASWALRIVEGRDTALLGVAVDKPPLLPYFLAAFFRLAGHTSASAVESATLVAIARFASVAASVLSVALLWAIARRVYSQQTALWAATLYAVSPLAARLSPSLLTDPWLVLWMLLGLWAGLQRRSWLTGLACGLAFATKQQAVLVIPFIVAVYWLAPRLSTTGYRRNTPPELSLRSAARLAAGFLLVFSVVLWWDSLRWQSMPGFWDRSAAAYGGLEFAGAAGVLERTAKWAELFIYTFGWPLLCLLVLASVSALVAGWVRLSAFDKVLAVGIIGYLGVHLTTSMAPWDRYALPLVPLLALLLGHSSAQIWQHLATDGKVGPALKVFDGFCRLATLRRAFAACLVAGVIYAGGLAASGDIPIGDFSAYDGVAQVAEHVRQTQPPGTTLYHHSLGWHFGFYLANDPVDLRYWDTPQDLASKAAHNPGGRQLIALPVGEDGAVVLNALREAGLRLRLELAVSHQHGSRSITLYRIVPTGSTKPPGVRTTTATSQGAGSHDG